jgi:hypothetical protein
VNSSPAPTPSEALPQLLWQLFLISAAHLLPLLPAQRLLSGTVTPGMKEERMGCSQAYSQVLGTTLKFQSVVGRDACREKVSLSNLTKKCRELQKRVRKTLGMKPFLILLMLKSQSYRA